MFRMKTRKPLRIKAPITIYEDGTIINNSQNLSGQFIIHYAQRIRSLISFFLLIFLGASIGIFTPRIFTLPEFTPESLLDAIFIQPLPPLLVIYGSFSAAAVYSIFFYRTKKMKSNHREKDPIGRFLGVTFLLICLDLYLLNINSIMLINFSVDFQRYQDFFTSQVATILVMVVLSSMYRSIASLSIPSPVLLKLPSQWMNPYGLLRFFVTSLAILVMVVFVSTNGLPARYNQPIEQLPFLNLNSFTYPELSALITGLVVIAFSFWPQKLQETRGSYGFTRLILVISGTISMGLLYRKLGITEGFVAAGSTAFILMLFAIPLQRSIS